MGHSDSTVTLEVYRHFIPDMQEKLVFALNNISKNDCKLFFATGICRFPQAGDPRQEYGFAVLTNRGRIHEKEYKKCRMQPCNDCFCDGNLPFPASGSPSARIRLRRIDEPRTDSRERVQKMPNAALQ